MNMTDAESLDATGKTITERLEGIEDRLQQVEIDVREAKGIGLEARSVAMQARDRALLAFGHAETDPNLTPIGDSEGYTDEQKAAILRGFGEPGPIEPIDPIATYDRVVVAAARHGAVVLDSETHEHLMATLRGVRDAMDLAVGALSKGTPEA